MAEWQAVAPHFKQVWDRGRPVKLDGAIGWVVLDVDAKPLGPTRVVAQTTCAFFEKARVASRLELLPQLRAYRCVVTPDSAFAAWCVQNGFDRVVAIPELEETCKDSSAAQQAVGQMAKCLVDR
jgi:hypothetical protein